MPGFSDHPGSDCDFKVIEYNLKAFLYNSFLDSKDIPHSGITEEVKLCSIIITTILLSCVHCMCVFSVTLGFTLCVCVCFFCNSLFCIVCVFFL